ncbi:PP2C family protein-serine/threonine phosphatase [Kribbella sp. CA-247076]|uniref:PP2C family protein-serine/threonine phosphatase n=1 Tax=Kribbella sp. CA-247076 TaxID=3239941 RepID=UPI003D92992D
MTGPDQVQDPEAHPSASAADGFAPVRRELVEEVGQAMAGSLNPRRSVLQLLDSLCPELADWVVVVLSNPRTGGLQLFGGNDVASMIKVSRRAVAGLALDRVLATGLTEVLHVALDGVEDGLGSLVPHQGLRDQAVALRPADVLGIGLTARGTTFGALIAVRGQGRGFGPDDIAVAEQVAARAALALDSARMYEQRARIASALQASLLPPDLPVVPGVDLGARYRPAMEQLDVGGDFYDVFGADDDWLVVLGDVCGKGVDAAVLTGRARQSLRTAAHFERDPAALLSALNAVFVEDISHRFITLVCLRVRPDADGTLSVGVAVAGHSAPILVRADGSVGEVAAEGTVLGVVPVADYETVTVRLEAGDRLVMYTDGVEEARGDDGFYGHARLVGLLRQYAGAAADVLCAAIEQDVVEYLDGRAHDDIAVLALGCTGVNT